MLVPPPPPPPLPRLADDLTALTSMMRALYPRAAALAADVAGVRDEPTCKQQAAIAQKRDALVQTETTRASATNVNFDAAERVPREDDLDNLFRLLAIKDAVILKMRSLLPPPLSKHVTHGLPKRAASLIADARHREAVLNLQVRELTLQLAAFREREARAVQVNADLRRHLSETNTLILKHEVHTLRTDLHASLAREAQLQDELLVAHERIGRAEGLLVRNAAVERELRSDLRQVADVAVHAMAARSAMALGDPALATYGSPDF